MSIPDLLLPRPYDARSAASVNDPLAALAGASPFGIENIRAGGLDSFAVDDAAHGGQAFTPALFSAPYDNPQPFAGGVPSPILTRAGFTVPAGSLLTVRGRVSIANAFVLNGHGMQAGSVAAIRFEYDIGAGNVIAFSSQREKSAQLGSNHGVVVTHWSYAAAVDTTFASLSLMLWDTTLGGSIRLNAAQLFGAVRHKVI